MTRYLPLAVAVLIGCALTLTVFFLERRNEHRLARENFERIASRHFTILKQKIDTQLESVESIAALYAASRMVSRAEFKAFVNAEGKGRSGIQALEWVPRVGAGERAAHEAAARREGIGDYLIRERSKQGPMVSDAAREEYFPVYFVEPVAGNEAALGFDLASNPARLEALGRARDSGKLVVTERIGLVQETAEQFGFLAVQPIYRNGAPSGDARQRRDNLLGFSLGVFRVGDMIQAADHETQGEIQGNIEMTLLDRSAPAGRQLLHAPAGHAREASHAACTERNLTVGGRQWSVKLCEAPEQAVAAIHKSSWVILGAGLTISLALAAYLAATGAQNRRREVSERRIHESETRYRDVVDNAHLLVQSIDSKSGRFEFANQAWLTALGRESGDLAELTLSDIVQPASLVPFMAAVERARESGEVREVRARLVARDGGLVQVDGAVFCRPDVDGAEITHAILSDVSEINSARAEVERIAADLTQLIETANAPIFGIDTRGRVTEWNQTIAKITGCAKDDVVGQDLVETLVSPEHGNNVRAELAAALQGRQTANYELSFTCKSGARVDVLSNSMPRRDSDGRIVGVVVFGQDITERRQKEAELRQAQRMEAIGQLTGGIAHDFNNLLTVVRGNLQLLQEELAAEGPAETRELIEDALSAAEDGAELTSGLLAFSRKQALEPKSTEISPLLQRVMRFLRRSLGEGIELELDISQRIDRLFVDPSQLESALLNLAVNARDAMNGSGVLRLKADRTTVVRGHRDADFEDAEPGNYVRIAVSDNGCGMPRDVLTQAFEPFYTTKEAGEGTGLGLSMVLGFARQSGGGIQAVSTPGKGTAISILIPEGKVELAAKDAPETGFENAPGGTETILVVEDETRVRRFALRCLNSLGYRTFAAANAKEALDILNSEPTVELMFSDIVMPGGINGHELAALARAKYPHLLVQLTSGFSKGAGGEIPKGDQRESIIRKPYTKVELASRLRALLDTAMDRAVWRDTGTD